MSDPVTNVEIEDVLSSIRRLVSEGDKPRNPTPDTTPEPEKPADRLVLTPALRVEAPAERDDVVESLDAPAEEIVADLDPEAAFLDLSDSEPHQPDELEDSIPEAGPNRDSLEATIAELEAAVTAQPDEWEPDGSEVSTVPSWDQAVFPPDHDADIEDEIDTPEIVSAVTLPTPDQQIFDAADDAGEDTAPASQTVAFSTARAERVSEDEAANEETPADSRVAFRHLSRDTLGEDFGDDLIGTPAGEDDDLSAFLAHDPAIDEEALRQMVLDIVRDELQGKLGERITRNVRKLVRREIMRVLNAQDMD